MGLHAEEGLDVSGAARVAAGPDLRAVSLGRLWRGGDDRRRQVDDPWHARILRVRLKPPVPPRSRMPRLLKTVLTVALSSFLLAAPAAGAQSTKTLLKRTKQALTPGGRPIEPTPLLRDLAVGLPSLPGSERRPAAAV